MPLTCNNTAACGKQSFPAKSASCWFADARFEGVEITHAKRELPDGSACLALGLQFDPDKPEAMEACLQWLLQQAPLHDTYWLFGLAFIDPAHSRASAVLQQFSCGVQQLCDHAHSELACVQLLAVIKPQRAVRYLCNAEQAKVAWHDDGWFEYAWLSAALPPAQAATLDLAQAVPQSFACIENFLQQNKLELQQLCRTWIYLPQLLQCYAAFNVARNALFERCGLFASGVPSSTGISAANRQASPISLSALALRPQAEDGCSSARAVPSPLQCPAPDYASAFARAHRIDTPAYSRLLVSGTAAIWPDGTSAWRGNISKQIELTMQVIAAMLQQQGLQWEDGVRALVYLKQPQYREDFNKWLAACAQWPQHMALCFVHADVCRDELLFEIEMDFFRLH